MTLWTAVLLASVICLALKAVGYLLPEAWVRAPRPARIADLLTVALLSALVAVQTVGAGQALAVDARVPAVLVAAYDDGQGVTAAFNKNLLVRANAELGADFDLDAFEHVAVWNAAESRMEMHLRSTRDQNVRIGEATIRFAKGETIHTESSRKYTRASVIKLAEAAGWTVTLFETSAEPSVALALLSAS